MPWRARRAASTCSASTPTTTTASCCRSRWRSRRRSRSATRSAAEFTLRSDGFARELRFTLDRLPDEPFGRYVFGCLQRDRAARPRRLPPLDIHVASELPMGVGLSSSAALEVATLRALRRLLGRRDRRRRDRADGAARRDRLRRASAAASWTRWRRASPTPSTPSSSTRARLETRLWSLPAGTAVLVIDSGVPRSLVTSKFNQRRANARKRARGSALPACATSAASARSNRCPIRGASAPATSSARTSASLRAVAGADGAKLGRLMNESHASLRDDYEVSIAELDRLVSLLQEHPAVHGAKLTGRRLRRRLRRASARPTASATSPPRCSATTAASAAAAGCSRRPSCSPDASARPLRRDVEPKRRRALDETPLQPLERRQRLADHLVHVVVLVGREAADEGDVGAAARRRPRRAGRARRSPAAAPDSTGSPSACGYS